MRKKIILSILSAYVFINVSAQTVTTNPTTISGSVDAYFRYNLGKAQTTGYNNKTSFTNSHNSFELGMASLKVDHSIKKVSATIDLGFGKRAEEFSFADKNTLFAVKQAYISFAATSKVKFTMGKWGTHVGYEFVDAFSNRNYSMAYMFSAGPFSHTGLKADFTLKGKNTFMIGVANATNVTSISSTTAGYKNLLAQYGWASKNDSFKLYVNYVGTGFGTGISSNQFDVVATKIFTSKFNIGYNGTIALQHTKSSNANANWWGSALYFNYDPTNTWGLTLRTEYFSDKKLPVIVASNVVDATLSLNYKVGALTIIPELRLDNASNSIFYKGDGSATKSTVTALLAAVYKF